MRPSIVIAIASVVAAGSFAAGATWAQQQAATRREPQFENLWYGVVPDSNDEAGRVVTCSYWIFESEHLARCNSFATLGLPI